MLGDLTPSPAALDAFYIYFGMLHKNVLKAELMCPLANCGERMFFSCLEIQTIIIPFSELLFVKYWLRDKVEVSYNKHMGLL